MEIIDRYIYAVTKRLPQAQRTDIGEELRGLIADMLEDKVGNREATNQEVEDVLTELGNPYDLATKYGGAKNYLISPELFFPYLTILKIVLFGILIAMTVVFVIEVIIDPNAMMQHFLNFIGSIINVATGAFAWITISFAIADYYGLIPPEMKHSRIGNWKPSDLPAVPDKKRQIKRGEVITGIVFSVIGLVFIISYNHLFGIPIFENDQLITIVPFLNEEALSRFLPAIYIIVGIGILKECIKLIFGKWTKKLAIINVLLNIATFAFVFLLVVDKVIWNPDFMQQLAQYTGINPDGEDYTTIEAIWENSTSVVFIGFLIVLIVDTVTVFFKALKK
ncbi:HAAS signaling domain-containing protein [Radiobacillus sp. PE A8.2]|uniref:HAAS signaling domain-containing protein n=1 Tax=Radiobacillus sp. PE A8.2 TaxID=3380349 RepID=UPI00388FA858